MEVILRKSISGRNCVRIENELYLQNLRNNCKECCVVISNEIYTKDFNKYNSFVIVNSVY